MAKKQVPVVVPVSPLKAIVDKIADKADKTLGYSEEVVNKVGAGQEAQYTGLQSVYKQKEANFFDPYEDYVDRNTLHGGQFSVEDLNKIRAVNQSNWQQAGHAIGRVAVNIVPQIIGGISSMVDIPGYFSAEHAAQNKLVNWAQDLKKEVDEDWFPIYEENPGQSMSMSDPAWWMSRGSGLVESVGSFIVQGMVGGKLVSTGLKGLGAIGGKKLAQTVLGAQKSKQLAGAGGALLNATMLNQAESVIDATQVFNDTYKQRLKEGYDTPKAKKAAAEAASMTMNLNKINILLNLSSAAAFLKPLGGSRNILKATSGIGKLVELGKESGQEGLEELVNLVAQKSGEAKGKGKDYTLQNALEDIGSMEGLESAFLGAIGGLAQTGATKASEYSKYGAGNTVDENGNRISNVTYEKGKYAEQQAVIKDLKDRGVNVTDVMKNFKDNLLFQEKLFKAQEKGDTAEVERLKEELFETQAIKAFQSGTTEVLENLYQAEAEKDPAEVGQEHIAKATDAIVQLKELEKVYNNFEDYANVDEIFFNRANKNRIERNLKYAEIVQKQADLQLNKDLHTIAKKYSYDREREVLIKKDGEVVEVDKKIDKIPLSYSATNLEDNQGHTEAEQAVYNKFLEEVQALPSYKAAESNREELDKMNNVLLNSDKEFATITSKEYQIKAEERKIAAATLKEAYAAISSTNSIAEVEKLKETIADPAFKKAADAKIADLKTTNDIVAKQKQVDLTVSQMQQKIKTATLENIQELREEVENAELSEKHKTNLSQALDKQSRKLNGIVETEEDAEEDNPLAAFDAKDPAELANEVAAENASFETNLPKDLPNPNTETEDVEQGVADAATKLATEDKTMIIGEDSQGNLVYGYSRSSEGHNRAAFLSREFNQTEVTGRIDRDEIENSLDNLELLDPDFLTAGTALNMQIDAEYEGDKYDPTSNTRQKTPWSLREAELRNQAEAQGIPLTSLPAYIAEVPIKVTTENGDTVFYVHDNAWYKEENLSATAEEIAEDKAKNYKIREAIVKKGTPVKTKVSYKSFGKLFKTFDGKSMPVAEAMPDPNLIFAVGRNGTFELPGDASIILKGGTLLKSTAAEGRVYAIVKVGPKEYLPIPLERKPISQEVIDSIMFAIEAHLTGDPENAVVIAIAEKSGLDITTNAGLTKYINQFMYLFPTKGKAGLENYLIAGGEGTSLKSNMPLISVTATGIEFGRPGVNMGSYTKPDGTKVVRRAIILSQNFKSKVGTATNAAGLETLRNLLQDSRYTPLSHTSRKDLSSDADSTLILDADGATKTQKYSEQVKQSLETNILSVNIGTEEDPNWVYTIQPTILFDTAFAGIKEVKKAAVSIPKVQKTVQSNKKALEYKGVNPTVDLIVTRVVDGETQVLLIKRGDNVEAEAGKLAFPGGFQDTAAKKGNKWKPGKETAEEAAIRELKEETGLDLNKSSLPLLLLNVGTFNDQARDPRNSATSWVSSTVFRVTLPENFDMSTEVSGKDDAQEARWIPVSELSATDKSQFGFDHATILESEGLVSFKEAAPNTKRTITRKYVKLETPITDFSVEEQALLSNPTPTIEEYEAVVQKLEEYLKDTGNTLNLPIPNAKEIKSILQDIKNSFEISDKESTPSDIESKKADIERIKQEQEQIIELSRSINPGVTAANSYNDSINKGVWASKEEAIDAMNAEMEEVSDWIDSMVDAGIDVQEIINKVGTITQGKGKASGKLLASQRLNLYNFIKSKSKGEITDSLIDIINSSEDQINAKYNAKIAALGQPTSNKTIETLRAEEQIELAKAIPNIADFIGSGPEDTYGENQGNMPDDLYAIYKPIYDKYNKLITALSPSKPTAEEQVEELTGDARIEAYAQDIIGSGQTLPAIEGALENFDLGSIPLQVALDMGFSSLEEAKAAFVKAKEIFIANAKESKTITLPNGLTIKVDKNTLDTNAISDDEIDELIPEMTEEQLTAQKNEIDEMIVRGLDTATQSSLISYLSADIITQTLAVKEVDGKQTVKVKPILDKHLEALKELSKFYKEQGLDNKAARLDAIVDQFDKVRRLVNQNMSKFSTGGVSEDVELDSNEEVSGLVRTNYTDDWAFTVSSKSTASGDLKKFFSIVQAQDEDGPMVNILGLPEIISYDIVYDTLHEILANKPADFGLMLDILELNIEKFPWIKSVITQLESAPEKIQNEFVSDMTKHHINMQFIMWSKDYKGNYSLQKWSSNSSSIEQRLRSIWNSNLKGVATQSNLVAVDEDDEYVFNKNVGDNLINQAKEWAKNPAEVTNDELATWLGNFGIVLTDKTYEDLRKGRFNNQGKKSWNALFTHGAGIVRALSKSLDDVIKGEINFQDAELLNDSSVKALAKLDASNNLNTFSNSFQAGGKTIYSYGNNNFLVNRMRDLTAYNDEDGTFVNPELIDSLKAISFTKNSTWLAELTDTGAAGKAMRNNFRVNYLSLEALKKAFTKSQDNRKLNNLTTAEHEVAKIAFFQNVSGDNINGEDRRIVDFFYPTMSDKTSMLTISTLARKLVLENGQLSAQNLELLYETLVTPEINRIRDNQATNIKGYEPNYFYFLHSLNELMITTGTDEAGTPIQKSFLDIVKDKDDYIYSEEVKTAVLEEVRNTFNTLIENKLADWEKLGIGKIITDDKGRVTDNFSFLDKEYMSKVANNGIGAARTRYAAMDYVFNYLIANAEAHKLFAGDPALYAKFNSEKTLEENLQETFINIGKRLAGDIAPGMELANSANNKYYQIFLEDQEMESNNVKDSAQKEYFSKIIKDFAKNYSGIEGSDAQEYTTWKEHLYVMKQLGRLTKAQYETCYKKLEGQSKGDFRESNKLTFKEMGMIMQPMKPVYVGNIASVEDNADRRIYIKSSSFPLLPELTAGMQMDKIRKGLETFESKIGSRVTADGTPAFVRASFGTANKVGAIPQLNDEEFKELKRNNSNAKRSAKVFNKDGNVVDNLVFSEDNALLLSRQNFRIQQDVPYSREKDYVNIGTQERKLLFVNTLDLEIEPGVKGEDLMALYNQNYEELYQYAHEELSKKLGLIQEITTKNDLTSLLELPFSEGITAGIFERVSELEEQVKAASPVKTVELYQDFADEVGDNTLERVNFINKNFDSIVESLVTAKPEIFKDENNEFKKCE
jgi:ADP-ribose pyrophosphatase YjhB (NUDIX family)